MVGGPYGLRLNYPLSSREGDKVTDALSPKSIVTLAMLQGLPKELLKEIMDI